MIDFKSFIVISLIVVSIVFAIAVAIIVSTSYGNDKDGKDD